MEDGEGREIDFKNTVIILTSNAATDTLMEFCSDGNEVPAVDDLVSAIKPELNRIFKPAFLGRLVIAPFFPLRDEVMRDIIRLKLAKIQRRLEETHRVKMTYSDDVVDEIARRCTEVESGARAVDNVVTGMMLPHLAKIVLAGADAPICPSVIYARTDNDGQLFIARS
jgi:type VI secretion system protein VasG